MNDSLHISPAGLAIEKKYEKGPPKISPQGFATRMYIDDAGYPTTGWGHRIFSKSDPLMTAVIDETIAEQLLVQDNLYAENGVKKLVRVPLRQCEFDPLTSLVFNIGPGKADGIPGDFADSTLLRKLNAGDKVGAADQFLVWNKYRDQKCGCLKVANGLKERRELERALFLGVTRA
ncbi:MAG: Lysozyme RrrD [Herbaspirillum frisingense]|uniref:Lysozyme n=1 Tax=Herbaspirillum frisingense TaxID=92645 RepID=A0A7V8JUB8_9BURK|nr:MAG: Lysozyme RrrD [Herbaspirillum frisingense]